jgi:hypothetical protein
MPNSPTRKSPGKKNSKGSKSSKSSTRSKRLAALRARKTAKNRLNSNGEYKSKLYYGWHGVAEAAAFEAKRRKWKPIEQPPDETEENYRESVLRDWIAPDVRDFTALMNAFPVDYNMIEEEDGTYLFEAVINDDEFERIRGEFTDHKMALEFEEYIVIRLHHALSKHPEIYQIKPTRNKDQIALFRVLPPPALAAEPVRLVSLNDMKKYFPFVIWNQDKTIAMSTYAITMNNHIVQDMSRKAGHNLEPELRASLLDALRASRSWHVLRGKGRELCRIEMIPKKR